MLRRARAVLVAIIVLEASGPAVARAQEQINLQADFLFYGDNTEFRNPFREGETIFGAAVRTAIVFPLGDRADVSLGAFGNVRFGSEDAFERVRPVIALQIHGRRSTVVFGTLVSPAAARVPGPDRTGPHGLLPPLQRETLAFDRPYEAGLQWLFTGPRWRHDIWIDWQRLNTQAHRERFDAGAVVEWRLGRNVTLPLQLHVVHEGGQLFSSGPVADSAAAAAGLSLHGKIGASYAAAELFVLGSRYVPDRAAPARSRNGAGFLGRGSVERAGWRGHVLFFRGDDYVKDEGDPNYMAVRRNGTRYRGVRDYAEGGLTRTFSMAPAVRLEVSARLHRVEHHYEYSYRVLGVASVRRTLK